MIKSSLLKLNRFCENIILWELVSIPQQNPRPTWNRAFLLEFKPSVRRLKIHLSSGSQISSLHDTKANKILALCLL